MSEKLARIDPTTVPYSGDPSRGIYRYRVYFQAGGHDMEIDYFAMSSHEANVFFAEDYPQDDVYVERVVNLTRNPQARRKG